MEENTINKWRVIRDTPRPGAEGLALDEALLKSVSAGFAPNTLKIYYFSPPSAILGIHQSVSEVDLHFIHQSAFDLNRRLTGGGAILLGLPEAHSQMGISIITRNGAKLPPALRGKFDFFTNILLETLKVVGLQPEKDDKFNIVIGGKKIAGCGIYTEESAVIFHAMILLDCDYNATVRLLKVSPGAPLNLIMKSMCDNITTTKIESGTLIHYRDIENALIVSLTALSKEILVEGHYSDTEMTESQLLLTSKYSTSEWIYGSKEMNSNLGACFAPIPSLKNESKKI